MTRGILRTEFTNREAWLEARRSGIGASEAYYVLGRSDRYNSPLSIWESKINPPPYEPPTGPAKAGLLFEKAIADWTIEENPELSYIGNPDSETITVYRLAKPDLQFVQATPDFIVCSPEREGGGVLQIKNRSEWKAEELSGDEPPLKELVQVQHELAATDLDWGILSACIGGNRRVQWTIERDESFIDVMIARERAWWETYVLGNTPPPADESEATTDAIKRLFGEVKATGSVTLPDGYLPIVEAWLEAKAAKKEAEAKISEAANQIMLAIGEAEEAILPVPVGDISRITWRSHSRAVTKVVKTGETKTQRTLRAAK